MSFCGIYNKSVEGIGGGGEGGKMKKIGYCR